MTTTQKQHQPPQQLPVTGFIRAKVLLQFVPFSSSTLWRKVKAGEFPKPVKLSANISAFKAEDISAWIESKEQGAA